MMTPSITRARAPIGKARPWPRWLPVIALLALAVPGWAQGTAFTYQGSLNEGASPANGNYDLRLTVFDAATDGNPLGTATEITGHPIANGLFTVTVDPGTGVFTGPSRWLELQVRAAGAPTYVTIAPRQLLTPTPYAIRAASAETAATATVAATANSVSGSAITGTVRDAQLSGNVALRNGGNAFTGDQTVAGQITATRFVGDGSQLTGIHGASAAKIVSTDSASAEPNATYVVNRNGTVTFRLPDTANVGDTVKVSGAGQGGWTLTGAIQGSHPEPWIPQGTFEESWVSVASSADGMKLVAQTTDGFGVRHALHTSADGGQTWTVHPTYFGLNQEWRSVAISADGTLLVAAASGGVPLIVSKNHMVSWVVVGPRESWTSVASSADGKRLIASAEGGKLYLSQDSGAGWALRGPTENWQAVASSADGNTLVAAAKPGQIHVSKDGGQTWVPRGSTGEWMSVASSADGSRLFAAAMRGQIHVSTDGGQTWVPRAHLAEWRSVASSADGTRLIAAADNNRLYASLNGGATWVAVGPGGRWKAVASSADGVRLIAAPSYGLIHTAVAPPAIQGGPSDSMEMRYTADGLWLPITPNGLNAANIASGTLSDSRLSANVALRQGGNAFTGDQTVAGTVAATAFAGDGSRLTGIQMKLPVQVVTDFHAVTQPGITYLANHPQSMTLDLPATAKVGDTLKVSGVGQGTWTLSGDIAGYGNNTPWTARASARDWRSVATSADGTKQVAAGPGEKLYTSHNGGITWIARDAVRYWKAVASSADGTRLIAAVLDGRLYTSTDSGVSWFARASDQGWQSVASSDDGTKLVAVATIGKIHTSTDGGLNWVARETDRAWQSVASSADGSRLVAVAMFGPLFTSTDGGQSWIPRQSDQRWTSVASSADGYTLAATVAGGLIYTSTDGGENWVARGSVRDWTSIALSADGTRMAATVEGGRIYTSTDGGANWVARESNRIWTSVASSAEGTRLIAAAAGDHLYTSTDPVAFPEGGPGDSAELWFTDKGNWQSVFSPAQAARLGGDNEFSANQTIRAGSTTAPFPQLRVAAAATAPYGAFLSIDATHTVGGKDYLIYSTGGAAGEGTGKLVTQNFTDGKIIQTLTANGNLGLGTTTPSVRLHIKQQTDNSGFAGANDGIHLESASGEGWRIQTQAAGDLVFDSVGGSGYAYISRNSGSFNITSDARFKRDVQPLGPLLDRVLALEPVSFRYLEAPDNSPPVVGFLAQQVLPLFPEVVDEKDGKYAIGYSGFGPIAIGAIQDLNTKLESKLAAKEAELTEVKARLERLEKLVTEKLGGGR